MKREIWLNEDDVKSTLEVDAPCFRRNGHIFYCIPESGDSISVNTGEMLGIAWTCFENSLGKQTEVCTRTDFQMAYRQTAKRLKEICGLNISKNSQ